jgi:hypothetical protein
MRMEVNPLFGRTQSPTFAAGLRYILSHSVITLLAIGIAFTLPKAAGYILYSWWPKVEENTQLLLVTEIGFAAVLVLLFNVLMVLWENHRFVSSARLASLVFACENGGWLHPWRDRRLARRLPASRDVYVLAVTGYNTFVDRSSPFEGVLRNGYDIRVMLLHPLSEGARERIQSFTDRTLSEDALVREVEASIACLDQLRRAGKKVELKFYGYAPTWKIVVLDEHVWVQYCHRGTELKTAPEYVFALHPRDPKKGFYVPFYMHFTENWNSGGHPEYDFETRELVYRDVTGNETRRVPFHLSKTDDVRVAVAA